MRVEVNGADLYVDVDGAQLGTVDERLVERPVVVVLHGGPGFDQSYLRPGLGPLRSVAQLVFVDLRGQGRSVAPVAVETCTLEQMADDIAAVILKLGLGRPVVFGHSAGGFVGLHLALRHAVAVGGLVLCNTTPTLVPFPDDDPPPGLAERATPEALEVAGRMFGGDFSPGWDRFISLVAPYYAAPNHMDVPQRVLELSAFAPEIAQHFFTSLAPTYDVRPRLGEIRVPTLVVVGRHDWVCRRAPAGDEHRRSPAGRARRRRALHLRRGAGSLSGRGAVLPCHVAV